MNFGERLKSARTAKGYTQEQLAQLIGVAKSTLTGYEKGNREPDFFKIKALASVLDVSADYLLETEQGPTAEKASFSLDNLEIEHIKKYRALDEHGKKIIDAILDIESTRNDTEKLPQMPKTKTIPLYRSPSAAGIVSPVAGADYEEYEVDIDCKADFATHIQGDSMEPYIKDGSIVLVKRQIDLKDGDVGIFFVDGGMLCKQYCEDCYGNIYLFSLNRDRKDADLTIWASSQKTVLCYGKVIMKKRVPLPGY